jgi:hypothetical protein
MTWHRDSHGLFDFEANIYKKHQIIVKSTGNHFVLALILFIGLFARNPTKDETLTYLHPRDISNADLTDPLGTLIYS